MIGALLLIGGLLLLEVVTQETYDASEFIGECSVLFDSFPCLI